MNFKLNDLKSRTKNCLVAKIDKPDDELMFALILKNFSDRQIDIDKKFIIAVKLFTRAYIMWYGSNEQLRLPPFNDDGKRKWTVK